MLIHARARTCTHTYILQGSCLFHSLNHGIPNGGGGGATELRRVVADYVENSQSELISGTPIKDWIMYRTNSPSPSPSQRGCALRFCFPFLLWFMGHSTLSFFFYQLNIRGVRIILCFPGPSRPFVRMDPLLWLRHSHFLFSILAGGILVYLHRITQHGCGPETIGVVRLKSRYAASSKAWQCRYLRGQVMALRGSLFLGTQRIQR